ncbi:ABC transporter substrate-binding protein [Acidimicrobiales bacterium]|nr:ABC transporter substrate-binding protein [Acidimicrobiales bacterium]
MISRFIRLVAALLALAMFTAACGGGSDSGDTVSGGDTEVVDTSSTETTDDEPADSGSDDGAESADEPEESTDTVELIEVDDSEDPVFGGTLRYALEADVDGLNPVSSALSAPGLLMGVAVFDTLAVMTPEDEWVPYLAESFTPNDDFTVWTMTLRDGVEFHDGTPLDAAAIAVNFGTVLQDPLVGLAVRPFYNLENPIEVIDNLTVQYNLSGANANWPTSQSGQLGLVASPTWLEAALADPTLNQAPVGTGPFVYDNRNEDSVTRFVRNENWWNGDVYLDAVEFVTVTDPDTRNDLLLQGEIQALQTTNPASIDDLKNTDGIQNLLDDSGDESFIMMNSTATPFDDIRARKALTFATPRQNYIDLIGLGISQPANQMFTPSSPYYNPAVQQEADQPELVGDLVDSYCGDFPDNCTDGKIDMEFQWSGPSVVQTRIAELLDEGWSIGFNVNFQELPQDAHIQEVAFGVFDVVTWRQFGAPNPADDRIWLECATIGGLSLNWPRFCDESRDAILDQLALATTVEERQPLLFELSEKIQQDYLYVFALHSLWDHSFSENVRGMCGHSTPEGVDMRCVLNGRTWLSNVWFAE